LIVGFLPAGHDTKKQKDYLLHTLRPLIEKAKSGMCELFFVDASHFVMGGFASKLWGVTRRFIRTSSGRKRFNVLGALNFISKKMVTICNDTYINAQSVKALLDKLANEYAGKVINVVLDNAAYQHCKAVIEHAASVGINVYFLPTYSPNLNLIERVWRLIKKNVLYGAYSLTFEDYKRKIERFIATLQTEHIAEMTTLITEKFQTFDKVSILA
jgi:transposase